jgi:hypothetical protein
MALPEDAPKSKARTVYIINPPCSEEKIAVVAGAGLVVYDIIIDFIIYQP